MKVRTVGSRGGEAGVVGPEHMRCWWNTVEGWSSFRVECRKPRPRPLTPPPPPLVPPSQPNLSLPSLPDSVSVNTRASIRQWVESNGGSQP